MAAGPRSGARPNGCEKTMTGFSEMPGQDPNLPGYNPEHLGGFEAEPLSTRPANYPGKTLGIVGLILAIFFNVIGMIVSIVAYLQSKKAGYSNGFAVAGIVVGAILLLLVGVGSLLFISNGLAFIGLANNG